MTEIKHRERPADGEPEGALVLLHGRGADENDLYPLLDVLDPDRRLLGITARGPLSLPPGGQHWYVVPRVGYPDPDTFGDTYAALTAWFDSLPVPVDKIVVGGFSQGAVMSHALALGAGRAQPAGLLAMSGFIPVVPGWTASPEDRTDLPVAIAHGTLDPVISVEFGRDARDRLVAAGLPVLYRETNVPHTLDPAVLPDLRDWMPL
jgi:phospholipase/carboxylesterase